MLEYTEYEDYELVTNFGKARDFTEFLSRSSEIVIAPDREDEGDYTLEVTLTDGSQEYDRTMLLYVRGPVETLNEETISKTEPVETKEEN